MGKLICIAAVVLVLNGCMTERPVRVGDPYKPASLVYKAADDEVNRMAQASLLKILAKLDNPEELNPLLPQVTICGPFLWSKVKGHQSVANVELMGIRVNMPRVKNGRVVEIVKLEGQVLQGQEQVGQLWDGIAGCTELSTDDKIRKLTDDEKKIFWAMIPFNSIDEPIFIVEGDSHKFLACMTEEKGSYMPFWIDDLYGVRIEDP